jgi:hypothetical protein
MQRKMMASQLYLGIVISRGQRGLAAVASVRPLLIASEDRKQWVRKLSDSTARRDEFPNAGAISWLHPDDTAMEGTLWQFEITEQPTYFDHPEEPWRDRFMVLQHTVKPVCEVFELDRLGGEPDGREQLTIHGLRFPKGAPTTCYVRLENNLWSVPPLHFVKKSGAEKDWVVELPSTSCIRCVKWDQPVELTEIEYFGPHFVLPPNAHPVGRAYQRDWSPDEVVLGRVFRTLRKVDRKQQELLDSAESAVAGLAQLLAGSGRPVPNAEFEAARVRRAQAFLRRLNDVHAVARVANIAIESGPLADEIAKQKEAIFTEERTQARRKAEAELADEQAKLQKISKKVVEQQQKLDRLIKESKAEREAQVGRLEEDIARRVREATSKPEELLGSVALIRAVMGPTKTNGDAWHSSRHTPAEQLPTAV